LRASSPAASMTEGFEVFVQLVMAAMSTAPSFSSSVTVRSSRAQRALSGEIHTRAARGSEQTEGRSTEAHGIHRAGDAT